MQKLLPIVRRLVGDWSAIIFVEKKVVETVAEVASQLQTKTAAKRRIAVASCGTEALDGWNTGLKRHVQEKNI